MQTGEALAARWFALEHAGAHLQPGEKTLRERAYDALRILDRPESGRNGALGRKVEKPGSESPSGPSGQTDRTRHDCKHTNR
jgi:hypothetical protein